jgi:hypothetical protein
MVKISFGLVMSCLLSAAFLGSGAGCSDDSPVTPPPPASQDSGTPPVAQDAAPPPILRQMVTFCPVPNPEPIPYKPALSKAGLCSEAQLTGFVAACSKGGGCDAYVADAANADCLSKCIYLDADGGNAAAYGPSVGGVVNVAGYMETKGASKPCVEARHTRDQCLYVACNLCGTADQEKACRATASAAGGVCAAQEGSYASSCASAGDQAAIKAFTDDDAADRATILRAFCGT